MKRGHEGQYMVAMTALTALTYGVMESVPAWHVWEPTIGQFLVGSLMGLLAQRSVRRRKEARDRVLHKQTDSEPVGLETPTTDSYCQSCDDVHPSAEFSLDILGRWVCLDCRRLVDPDYSPPSVAPPTPPNGIPKVEDDEGPQHCDYCHDVSHRFIRLNNGDDLNVCQKCLDQLRPADAQRAQRKRKLTHADLLAAQIDKENNELLEETHKRLDIAEKKLARKGKSVEVAGGEYVRSMTGHQVVINGVDKGGIVKVEGMNCRAKVSKDVLALGRVIADGMNAEIFIAGNVGQGAKIRAVGMGARIVILGHIAGGASIRADGMNASIEYGTADSRGTTIQATGMNSTVVQRTKPSDNSFDVQPGQVWETPEDKRPTGEDKPPCAVCGAKSYYYMSIPQGNGQPAVGEHRCVRCAGAVRKYSPEEQSALQAQALQDQVNQLAAIHQVPAPIVGEDSGYDKVIQTAEMLTSRFRNLVPDEYIGLLRDDGKHR